jgi:hypothetical protein
MNNNRSWHRFEVWLTVFRPLREDCPKEWTNQLLECYWVSLFLWGSCSFSCAGKCGKDERHSSNQGMIGQSISTVPQLDWLQFNDRRSPSARVKCYTSEKRSKGWSSKAPPRAGRTGEDEILKTEFRKEGRCWKADGLRQRDDEEKRNWAQVTQQNEERDETLVQQWKSELNVVTVVNRHGSGCLDRIRVGVSWTLSEI